MITHIFNCLKLIIFDIDISHRYYFDNVLFLFLNKKIGINIFFWKFIITFLNLQIFIKTLYIIIKIAKLILWTLSVKFWKSRISLNLLACLILIIIVILWNFNNVLLNIFFRWNAHIIIFMHFLGGLIILIHLTTVYLFL